MASEAVAVAVALAALDSDSVFVECGIIRRLAMLLVGWGSLSAEKKTRWYGHWIGCAGLQWNPSAGCRTGEVELFDKNSGASWNEAIGRLEMLRIVGAGDDLLLQGDICTEELKLQRGQLGGSEGLASGLSIPRSGSIIP
jgi:hypothetical protein